MAFEATTSAFSEVGEGPSRLIATDWRTGPAEGSSRGRQGINQQLGGYASAERAENAHAESFSGVFVETGAEGRRRQSGHAATALPSPPTGITEVSPSSLHAALTALAATPPATFSPSPAPALQPGFPASGPYDLPIPSTEDVMTSPATPAQPLAATVSPSSRSRSNSSQRSRLSSFRDRLTPSRSAPLLEPEESAGDHADQQRLVGHPAMFPVTVAPTSPTWRDKGKGKLRQLLKPASPSSSTGRIAGGRVQLEVPVLPREQARRSPSRTRAYSEPLLRTLNTSSFSEAPIVASPAIQLGGPLPVLSSYCTAVSSPTEGDFPFSSLQESPAVCEPVPKDCFASLPRELQLTVFKAVLDVCEQDWAREVRKGEWVGEKARVRWSEGQAMGRRELMRLGRVSKAWRSLCLDGQLWPTAPASSLLGGDVVRADGLRSLFEHGGPFVRALDVKGLGTTTLDWLMLDRMVDAMKAFEFGGKTRLTRIDLTGCTHLTTASLSHLLCSSPELNDLTLIGLRIVTSTHMSTLAASCPRLLKLDVSRCPQLPASGLLRLPYPPKCRPCGDAKAPATSMRGLTTLRASSLSGMSDTIFCELLDRYPALEVLDLSFSNLITDAGLKSAATQTVAHSEASPSFSPGSHAARTTSYRRPSQNRLSSSAVNARLHTTLSATTRRVYSSLRHLNLSACPRLSHSSFSRLANSFPSLEILELSRFTSGGQTNGLVSFLSTVPELRKLDLEDADDATDDVLLTLAQHTPNLTHLLVSSCVALTDAGFTAVVNGCSKLRILEADGTTISDSTAKMFVALAKERAIRAQEEAARTKEDVDPLVRTRYPAVLSVLDNRQTGRRLSRDVGAASVRPRTGQRGYWTRAVGFYHDGEDDEANAPSGGKGVFDEMDERRVVVRSFYSSLAVDAATALRTSKAAKVKEATGSKGRRSGLLRSRAMSDSEVLRLSNEAEGRAGCIIS
ncbi:hypothetical protein JCM11251_005117 [Rhodosporidiobolus azoricus]